MMRHDKKGRMKMTLPSVLDSGWEVRLEAMPRGEVDVLIVNGDGNVLNRLGVDGEELRYAADGLRRLP